MLFRFIGTYTGDRASIAMGDVTFNDRDPSDVSDPDLIERLSKNPEFQKMHGVTQTSVDKSVKDAKAELAKFDHDGDGKAGGSKPKRKKAPAKAKAK